MPNTDRNNPSDKPLVGPPDKGNSIIVNGTMKTVETEEVSYEQAVNLAFADPPTGPNVLFKVAFRNAGGRKPEGTLTRGQSVKVKDGTVFDVTPTDKS